jgi:hypothetical protein
MTHEITPTAFKLFMSKCRKVKDLFGLHDIEIYVTTDDLKDDNANATFTRDYCKGRLDIQLNKNGIERNYGKKETDLAYVAFHEIVEGGLLGELSILASKDASESDKLEIERTCHAIVNRLWKAMKDKI